MIPVTLTEVNKTDWKFTGIYKITNIITGKCYIGQAVDIRSRLMEHVNNNHSKKFVIYKAIEKYGAENFEAKRWLFSFDKNDIVERIKYYTSGEYATQKQYRYTNHWILWRERNGRL